MVYYLRVQFCVYVLLADSVHMNAASYKSNFWLHIVEMWYLQLAMIILLQHSILKRLFFCITFFFAIMIVSV